MKMSISQRRSIDYQVHFIIIQCACIRNLSHLNAKHAELFLSGGFSLMSLSDNTLHPVISGAWTFTGDQLTPVITHTHSFPDVSAMNAMNTLISLMCLMHQLECLTDTHTKAPVSFIQACFFKNTKPGQWHVFLRVVRSSQYIIRTL